MESPTRSPRRRAAIVVGAVSAAALVGIGGLMLSPAQAQQAAAAIDHILSVINCQSSNPCAGGVNSGPGFGLIAIAAKNNAVDAATKTPSKTHAGRSGVYGHDDSTDGGTGNVGVAGFSPNGSGMQATSTNGTGLLAGSTNGISIYATGGNAGIVGNGPLGVLGNNTYGVGIGIEGYSTNGTAILGGVTIGTQHQVLEVDAGTANSGGHAMMAFNSNSTEIFAVDNAGNIGITGLIYTGGGCATGCSQTRHVRQYAPRESVPTTEDVGEGQLVAGKAFVALDPAFANVIDRSSAYVVFVSPEGPNQGLYVAQKTARGFVVMENPGGHSTIPFGYRIVAKPYGVTADRLPMIVQSQTPARARLHLGEAAPMRPTH